MSTEASRRPRLADNLRAELGARRILVAGDLMLDRYVWGDVSRISPEAPVPVLRHGHEATSAGGAGNVALNLTGLGLSVAIAGFVGEDEARHRLEDILLDAGIDTGGITVLDDRPTITKTRIVAGHQHVLRLDTEAAAPIDAVAADDMLDRIRRFLADGVDGVILSDYAKGGLSAETCQAIIRAARGHGVPVYVDPKGRDFAKYAGANVITPNVHELELASGADGSPIDALIEVGRSYVTDLGLEYMVLTRGPDGMTLIGADETLHRPAVAREVFDVTGAGDTVIASLAAGSVARLDHTDLLELANVAAGIVIGKVGTVAITQSEVLRELRARHQTPMGAVYSSDELRALVDEWRDAGERIVFTNGCFDILHAGHVTYLHRAAAEGDRLIVAINTDDSVRAIKGSARPVNGEEDRACVVAALGSVDAVVLFDEATPLDLINRLRPDVLVKGGDYAEQTVVGSAEVMGWGGRVVVVPLIEGRSTSAIIEQIATDAKRGAPA